MWLFRKKRRDELPPEVEAVFDKIYRFLHEEELQNQSYSPQFQQELAANQKTDVVPGAHGQFGFEPTNPIPVNGPFGQLIYLSSLRTLSGQKVAFHRLGSFSKLDVYELVSLDGTQWNILFLNMNYLGKSALSPNGFEKARTESRFLRGLNIRVDAFPVGLYAAAADFANRVFGMTLVDPDLRTLETIMARRPAAHSDLVATICSNALGWKERDDKTYSRRIRFQWSTMRDTEHRANFFVTFKTLADGQVSATCDDFPHFSRDYASWEEAEEEIPYHLSEYLAQFAGGPVMISSPDNFGHCKS
jgi:hypothetical protein